MTGKFELRDLGQPIPLAAVLEYLIRHGWQVREDGSRLACEGPPDDEGRPIVVFLPADESYADFVPRLEDLVSTLSQIEERSAVEVTREMLRDDDFGVQLSQGRIRLAPGQDRQQAIDEMRALETSAQLAIQNSRKDILTAWEEVALFAARFVRLVVVDLASSIFLWKRCDRILAEAGLRLPSSPELANELCRRVLKSTPENLDEVYLWMKVHTKRVDSAVAEGESHSADTNLADSPSDSGSLPR